MTAQLIDGNALSKQVRSEVAQRAAALSTRGVKPGLAVVLVGDNPASQVYVRNKVKACEEAGLHSVLERYDASMSEAELLARVEALNNDPSIHGILVQLPLPKHIDDHKVIEAISPAKDVDGFHVSSAGALMVGRIGEVGGFKACTPYGCMKMLEAIGMQDLRGKHAVVIGRSNIVGKPMAMMLLQANATVTVCHSGTADLAAMTRQADVIVAAVGKRNMLTADMVKPGAVVIDVGMNRNDEGKLCGDVDFDGVKQVAGFITPVPGGVGPMTITMLLVNTIESAERAAGTRGWNKGMNKGLKIRLDDLQGPEIRALLEEHLAHMHAESPPESVHALDMERLRRPEISFWTAWDEAQLLGCIALKQLDATHGEIKSMRTPAALRGRGAARALLHHLIEAARSRGMRRLSLETGTQASFEPARALYASFGFRETGPFADYAEDPYSCFMSLEL